MSTRILVGDVRAKLAELPDESVHCCVTSPPYMGLRSYGTEPQIWGGDKECPHEWAYAGKSGQRQRNGTEGGLHDGRAVDKLARNITLNPATGSFCKFCDAWSGELGLEPTLSLYLDHMVEICREIRRVLRKDGTFWLVIGDSYCNYRVGDKGGMPGQTLHAGAERGKPARPNKGNDGADEGRASGCPRRATKQAGLKEKDLMLIPSRLAIRLCDDGWYVRSDIAWCKRAGMPESVEDRPTSAWEHVFMLTKNSRYYYDGHAVKQITVSLDPEHSSYRPNSVAIGINGRKEFTAKNVSMRSYSAEGSNLRNFWLLSPEPFPQAHFAVYPTEIPRRAILASTSERGVCPKCAAPYERVVSKVRENRSNAAKAGTAIEGNGGATSEVRGDHDIRNGPCVETETIGWNSTCKCNAGEPIPATVLDCFLGAGTTALVADRLNRDSIGIELSPAYAEMARRRIEDDAGLFAQIAAE